MLVRANKFLNFINQQGSETLGLVTPKGILDVVVAGKKLGVQVPATVDQLLSQGDSDGLRTILDALNRESFEYLDEHQIKFGKLFLNPGKIICVGLNYARHAKEVGLQAPSAPPLFSKFNNSLAAHQSNIQLPSREVSSKVDYETELLIVVGKAMSHVKAADALNYVAGYCTANDLSARDLQMERPGGQWLIGKTLQGFAPIGPYLVGADLVKNPNDLTIKTWVNGELRQSSSTSDFIFNVQTVLEYISRHWTLEPGDIIFTGTPEGVIAGMPKEKQVWLKPGDEVVSSIEGLGDLKIKLV